MRLADPVLFSELAFLLGKLLEEDINCKHFNEEGMINGQ